MLPTGPVSPVEGPAPLAVASGTLACWLIDLAQPEARVAALARVLAADERERADRFVVASDHRRFVVARAGLRLLLARACGVPTATIRFAYGPHGKPSLVPATGVPPMHFSVSHSGDVAMIGVARDAPLGVDIEAVRPLPDLPDVAAGYFTAEETNTIREAPADERELAFFLCWTRKEAFAKARGDGLALALHRCRVACRPGDPARILEIDGSSAAAAAWSVYDLRPAPGLVGAAVVPGVPRPLSLVRFDVAHAAGA